MRTLEQIVKDIEGALGSRLAAASVRLGEITIEVKAADLIAAARILRDHDSLRLGQLTDLFGLDYLEYGGGGWEHQRFAVVYQLLSVDRNFRLRLRAFCEDDDAPMLDSVAEVWPVANWYEREAFDLYGIMFAGHPDLRRILTDYGFVGHPFRKDFPVSGYVEMRFDPEQKRVVYQPVTVEVREVVPRVIRDESYGGAA